MLDESNKSLLIDYDSVATFRFGGRESDLDAAQAVSATLSCLTDGLLLDGESGELIASTSVLEWARGNDYRVLGQYKISVPKNHVWLSKGTVIRLIMIAAGVLIGVLMAIQRL